MSNPIDEKLVRHVGKLSRIALRDEQVARFGEQLGAILTYFDKLKELPTDGVEPMAHALAVHNVFADDRAAESLPPEKALANAPQRDGDFYKVPKVIGDSQ